MFSHKILSIAWVKLAPWLAIVWGLRVTSEGVPGCGGMNLPSTTNWLCVGGQELGKVSGFQSSLVFISWNESCL